jgi:transcription-repair coupling factor (superfamily II helicase)
VANEAERLTLYRRLAAIGDGEELKALSEEMRDRFGALPPQVQNLFTSIQLKILASAAGVTAIALGPEFLVLRATPTGVYDRVSLYKRFGTQAKVSTNVLRIPRAILGSAYLDDIRAILADMVRLQESVRAGRPAAVGL